MTAAEFVPRFVPGFVPGSSLILKTGPPASGSSPRPLPVRGRGRTRARRVPRPPVRPQCVHAHHPKETHGQP
jgi:hypothetical protein